MTTNGHSKKAGAALLTHDTIDLAPDLRPDIGGNRGRDSERYHQAHEGAGVSAKSSPLALDFHDEARDLIHRAAALVATAEECIRKLVWLVGQAGAASGDPSTQATAQGEACDPESRSGIGRPSTTTGRIGYVVENEPPTVLSFKTIDSSRQTGTAPDVSTDAFEGVNAAGLEGVNENGAVGARVGDYHEGSPPQAQTKGYQGTVLLSVSFGIKTVKPALGFVNAICEGAMVRFLQLVGAGKDSLDLWIVLPEPTPLEDLILEIDGVASVEELDDTDKGTFDYHLLVRMSGGPAPHAA